MKLEIFNKTYDDELLCDYSRDIHEAFDSSFNELIKELPEPDEHGFNKGTFTFTITYNE